MRHVLICGMLGEDRDPGDAEVWTVNYAYRNQPNPDRVYFFDEPDDFQDGFFDELNDLDCPIYTKRVIPELRNSVEYPVEAVVDRTKVDYFTCSVAYMIAHALYENVDKLTLHGLYSRMDSIEYISHIPCINFWVGRAMSRMHIVVGAGSMIAKPFPWQPNRYGYIRQKNEWVANRFMSAAYVGAMNIPIEVVNGETGDTIHEPFLPRLVED